MADTTANLPAPEFMRQLQQRVETRHPAKRWSRGAGVVVAAAIAASVLVFFLTAPLQQGVQQTVRPVDTIGLKGSTLVVYRKRGKEVRSITARERLRVGDALRISVIKKQSGGRMAVWIVERGRKAELFFTTPTAVGVHTSPESAVIEEPCHDLFIVVLAEGDREKQALTLSALGRASRDRRLPAGAKALHLRCEMRQQTIN
jgi:hypothetical protein